MHRTDGLPTYRGRIHEAAFFASIPLGLALVAAGRAAAARVRMKRLDHSMIFVLIAGSSTPFCLLVIRGWWGGTLLAVVWAGALAGIVLKLVSPTVATW